jgi:hypothetical protein
VRAGLDDGGGDDDDHDDHDDDDNGIFRLAFYLILTVLALGLWVWLVCTTAAWHLK